MMKTTTEHHGCLDAAIRHAGKQDQGKNYSHDGMSAWNNRRMFNCSPVKPPAVFVYAYFLVHMCVPTPDFGMQHYAIRLDLLLL